MGWEMRAYGDANVGDAFVDEVEIFFSQMNTLQRRVEGNKLGG